MAKGRTTTKAEETYVKPPSLSFDGSEEPLDLFLLLTSYTCPHYFYGEEVREHDLYRASLEALGGTVDSIGNIHIFIGGSNTLFLCHMDTADTENRYASQKVNHIINDRVVRTDGSTILGADNKAGMTAMLKMIHAQVPGHYIFCVAEEVGCIGSRRLAAAYDWSGYDRAISFDREGFGSVITKQWNGRCASNIFAKALATHLNERLYTAEQLEAHRRKQLEIQLFDADPTGRATDSAEFIWQVPECTNLSMGSFGSHTEKEIQSIQFLRAMCRVVIEVPWESLPTARHLL
jgi:putative aminopeptidase FrvX